jgi:hypothetical protein
VGSDVDAPRIREAAARDARQFTLFTLPAPTLLVADCTHLPYRDQSLDVVVLDPPYLHYPGPHIAKDFYNSRATTAGMSHASIVRDLYCRGMLAAAYALKAGGLLLVKGKDEIERGQQCYVRDELPRAAQRCGFRDQDMFLYEAQWSLTLLPWAERAPQKHARKNHSYLFVFRLTAPPRRLIRGRPRKGSAASTLKGKRDRTYLRDRLMQDHPAIYARYMAGELPSVHAAAQVAGLVTTKTKGH